MPSVCHSSDLLVSMLSHLLINILYILRTGEAQNFTEILLKVALNTINQIKPEFNFQEHLSPIVSVHKPLSLLV